MIIEPLQISKDTHEQSRVVLIVGDALDQCL